MPEPHRIPNPLPCGCGIKGTPHLKSYGSDYELIQTYRGLHIVFCPLHAAAPAMREALEKAAMLIVKYGDPFSGYDQQAMADIRAALALSQAEKGATPVAPGKSTGVD